MNAKCDRCGSTNVRWVKAKNRAGEYFYLENVKRWHGDRYSVNRDYSNGPHYQTCGREAEMNNEYMRDALAARIINRYMVTFVVPLMAAGEFERIPFLSEKIADWRIAFMNR